MSTDIEKALYQLKSDAQIMKIHATNPKFKVIDLTCGKITENELLCRMHKNIEFLVAAYESNQLKELPFIAMFERVLDNVGKQRTTLKDSKYNGRYGVVYFDKKKWSAMPLMDLCGDKNYDIAVSTNRLNEVINDMHTYKDAHESDFDYIIRCVDLGKLPELDKLSGEGLLNVNP